MIQDFEKAFDKLEWPFIEKALKYYIYNFGSELIGWIKYSTLILKAALVTMDGALNISNSAEA